jgi:hypothetical protein
LLGTWQTKCTDLEYRVNALVEENARLVQTINDQSNLLREAHVEIAQLNNAKREADANINIMDKNIEQM